MLTNRRLELSCFASLDTLVPRVLKFCVASSPAVPEPRATTSAATEFAGFLDCTTCEADGTDGRRNGNCCLHVGNDHQYEEDNATKSLNSTNKNHASTPVQLGLTFARLHALKPAVIEFFVAGTCTTLVPIAARSATTHSPGFLERATI